MQQNNWVCWWRACLRFFYSLLSWWNLSQTNNTRTNMPAIFQGHVWSFSVPASNRAVSRQPIAVIPNDILWGAAGQIVRLTRFDFICCCKENKHFWEMHLRDIKQKWIYKSLSPQSQALLRSVAAAHTFAHKLELPINGLGTCPVITIMGIESM